MNKEELQMIKGSIDSVRNKVTSLESTKENEDMISIMFELTSAIDMIVNVLDNGKNIK